MALEGHVRGRLRSVCPVHPALEGRLPVRQARTSRHELRRKRDVGRQGLRRRRLLCRRRKGERKAREKDQDGGGQSHVDLGTVCIDHASRRAHGRSRQSGSGRHRAWSPGRQNGTAPERYLGRLGEPISSAAVGAGGVAAESVVGTPGTPGGAQVEARAGESCTFVLRQLRLARWIAIFSSICCKRRRSLGGSSSPWRWPPPAMQTPQ